MSIETTINIAGNTLGKIISITKITGKRKQEIITWALNRLSADSDFHQVPWSRVKYQLRDKNSNWTQIHIYLSPAEYEFFLDLRKMCKSSVSRLVAIALDRYINEITENKKISDNYGLKNYALSRIVIHGITCWILYWGIPPRLLSYP
ncbi:MAG: hypothetical protein E4G96_03870 [Chrysiogenales bacterium]|nr:MAG: hypothetical protein E4G96_03870 [Chrysiogenales bacterium]